MADGSSSRGTLQTISLTGGLLAVSGTLDRGSHVKLMFMTQTGPVAGAAEMLNPVSPTQQPFRFLALEQGAQRRLLTVIESEVLPPDAWIQKYRAAIGRQHARQHSLRRKAFRFVLASLAVAALLLGGSLCLLNMYR
jgi:hypothetical protein